MAVASQADPRPALDLLPAGVVNIVSGPREVLATHDDVAALWLAAEGPVRAWAERGAAGTLKPVWVPPVADWTRSRRGGGCS